MKILVLGGCGFIGSILVPMLATEHAVTVFDTEWFGNFITKTEKTKFIKGDIRNIETIPISGHDIIIHLANIANDPGVELNPSMSWEVNVLATQQIAEKASRSGVKQIIFASSGSVYGIKKELNVTEDLPLVPISVYNKTKMVAERVLLSYQDKLNIHCIRPATVCGWSPRMRLDVSVNILTFQALQNGIITVFGGEQTRPNIHISDIARVFKHFVDNPELTSGAYNAGFENISIKQIADRVIEKVGGKINILESNDPRSYRQNSDKLIATGFKPLASIDTAINEISQKFKENKLTDNVNWYTVKLMKKLGLDKS